MSNFILDCGKLMEKEKNFYEEHAKSTEQKNQDYEKELNELAKDMYEKIANTQVGGNHYQGLAIQPFEYADKNNMDPYQFSVVKYITRYKFKDGLKDLKKARDCINQLIKARYGDE